MCEANAYFDNDGIEETILEAVDVIEPEEDGSYRLVSIFGEQKTVSGKIKYLNLVNHKIVFEKTG